MENIEGKHFSITDSQNVKTVIYEINKTEKEMAKNAPKFTIQRLDYTEEFVGEKTKKTFYVDEPRPEGNRLAIFSFGKEKVIINNGILAGNRVLIEKTPLPFVFKKYYEDTDIEVKDFTYTPNLKRPITIIDLDTVEEVKPVLYFDEVTNEVKGKCTLKAHKNYFAFEIRQGQENDDYILVVEDKSGVTFSVESCIHGSP